MTTDDPKRRIVSTSYCRSCDGYTAEVGKLDESGWCERCTYRNALEAIRDQDWVENVLDPQWAAGVAKRALDSGEGEREEHSEALRVPRGFGETIGETRRSVGVMADD